MPLQVRIIMDHGLLLEAMTAAHMSISSRQVYQLKPWSMQMGDTFRLLSKYTGTLSVVEAFQGTRKSEKWLYCCSVHQPCKGVDNWVISVWFSSRRVSINCFLLCLPIPGIWLFRFVQQEVSAGPQHGHRDHVSCDHSSPCLHRPEQHRSISLL